MKSNATSSQIHCYKEAPFFEIRHTQHSDRSYEMHAHPTLSIGFMRESSTLFSTPHGEFTLIPGALAVIEPYVQHSCNPLNHTKRSYVMVYIDVTYCMQIQTKLFGASHALFPLVSPLIFHQPLFERFEMMVEKLILGYDYLHVKAFESWLEEFFWLYSKPTTTFQKSATMHDIALFLENRLDESYSLQDLSKRFRINPFVLVRKFKAEFGCTPTHYWHDARIHHAKKLLQHNTPLALCAQYCGFVDQSHFHRFFKRRTAMTPKEYQVNFIQ